MLGLVSLTDLLHAYSPSVVIWICVARFHLDIEGTLARDVIVMTMHNIGIYSLEA